MNDEFPVGSRVLYKANKMEEAELATVIPHNPKYPYMDNGTLVHIQPDNFISCYLGGKCLTLLES